MTAKINNHTVYNKCTELVTLSKLMILKDILIVQWSFSITENKKKVVRRNFSSTLNRNG